MTHPLLVFLDQLPLPPSRRTGETLEEWQQRAGDPDADVRWIYEPRYSHQGHRVYTGDSNCGKYFETAWRVRSSPVIHITISCNPYYGNVRLRTVSRMHSTALVCLALADHTPGHIPGNDRLQYGWRCAQLSFQRQKCMPSQGTDFHRNVPDVVMRMCMMVFPSYTVRFPYTQTTPQVGNRNCHPPRLGLMGYKKYVQYTAGTADDKRRARRRVSAVLTRWCLDMLAPFKDTGTLIDWPWGRLLRRNESGQIRIVPRVCGFPLDGPEAKLLTCVR